MSVAAGRLILTRARSAIRRSTAIASAKTKKTVPLRRIMWSRDLRRTYPPVSYTHLIRKLATRLDVFRNGHAMRRPTPGSLWGDHGNNGWPQGQREKLANFRHPRIALAHADLSGFSLFEEAQYRGVRAAERILLSADKGGS